ncbi:TIGR02594 family protein [Psychroserpens sp.]|jgi:uncharacterized protein (TIGR02594 family)|uniref:C40 family peptidase n=1 Tax=Psychroserpens sp. TaxID=2020870 RepID=UPI0039E5DE0F
MKDILEIASKEIGVKEMKGKGNNPRIIQYAKDTGFKNYKSDDSHWCSLFMNWCAHEAGLERSYSLGARSWLRVGMPIDNPELGDVVIFWRVSRESWQGHVGLFNGYSRDGRIYCLGGNQGDQVSSTGKSQDKILGYRRLRPVDDVRFPTKNLKKGSKGIEVKLLQDALKKLGFEVGTTDGDFGPRTEKELIQFQLTNQKLTANGFFDKATRAYMETILSGLISVKSLADKVF